MDELMWWCYVGMVWSSPTRYGNGMDKEGGLNEVAWLDG